MQVKKTKGKTTRRIQNYQMLYLTQYLSKCDGVHPKCSKCNRLGLECNYVVPSKPMPFGRNHYVASLERRVVELEDFLAKKDMLDQVPSFTLFGFQPSEIFSPPNVGGERCMAASSKRRLSSLNEFDSKSNDREDIDSMVRILRDLSLETNGGYIGATAQITMGRLVGSIVKGQNCGLGENSLPNQITSLQGNDPRELRLSDIPQDVADRLLIGYMKHIATRYPVLHSAWIRDLHSRRNFITNAFERSTLHLIYGTAGRFLETTGETSTSYFPERHQAEVLKDLE
jgi:hypothetical protein